jgi:hypothetical protein
MINHFGYWFPFVFAGIWVLIIFTISRGGWAALAASYSTSTPFKGHSVGFISASINGANYNNSLILKYNEVGIYLRPIFFFRLFHKPLLIPWKEIKEGPDKKYLFISFKELIIGTPTVATIRFRKSTFDDYLSPSIRNDVRMKGLIHK